MHFSANASDINAGMSLVGHALSARPTRAIFEGVLIETVDNGICLTCTDGEMIIRTRVNAMVVDEGVAIMPAKLFGELIRKLSGEVDVEIDKKFRAEVRAQGSNTSIQGTDASEFPDVPDVRGEFQISSSGWAKRFPRGISPSWSRQQGTSVPSQSTPSWSRSP